PVTRAVFPLSLNLSRMFTGSVRTAYQDLHAVAAALHLAHAVFEAIQRQHVGDEAIEREAGGGELDGVLKIDGFVDARAGEFQFTPEEAEEIDLGWLAVDGDHHDAAAGPRQFRHHVGAGLRAGDLEYHVGAGASSTLVDQRG